MSGYECPVGGSNCPGWYTLDVPFGHPDFGAAFPCVCAPQRTVNRLRQKWPAGLAGKTFEGFVVVEGNQAAFEASRALAEAEPVAGWLTIAGECGNGKTHLAAAIVNTLLNRGMPALFHTAPTLLDYLRATFAPDSGVSFDDRFEAIKTTQVLALDDLGAETATPWALDKLYQVLDHRYAWRLPTVVTTNVMWTSIPERIRSRLKDSALGKVVMNAAPDYRSIEGKKFYQAALKGARKRSDVNSA